MCLIIYVNIASSNIPMKTNLNMTINTTSVLLVAALLCILLFNLNPNVTIYMIVNINIITIM